ncbi:MAG TPA: type ISP restriction/modification enzyme [Pseudonocardiaceae bacterium]|nr:type ISP restriction/modification enzyme [Pseudonocardiaceae bacterium]
MQAGDGSAEDHLRGPLEQLIEQVGGTLGLAIHLLGETRLPALAVRPDYAVNAAGARVGYIELKRPGHGVPGTWPHPSKHDQDQWAKLSLLPNVLYTDGEQWALYRFGTLYRDRVARLRPNLLVAGDRLRVEGGDFDQVISSFLRWEPERPRNLDSLVRACAKLCKLLRQDVADEIIREETRQTNATVFTTLAEEWRRLLFPRMTGPAFADAYAQTVTFALLLARADGIDFAGRSVGEIALLLGKKHSLMGKALSVLTEQSEDDHSVVIETMLSVIGAVHWEDFPADSYTYLYERFAAEYDPDLRKKSGIYYTPAPVVRFMTRFVDDILRERLGREHGFATDDVLVVDPAMGTGSFLAEVIDTVAGTVAEIEGPGNVGPRLRQLASRLIGFECQIAPFAVAELRIHARLRARHRAEIPRKERRFLADALDDPNEQQLSLGSSYDAIAQSRRGANEVKRTEPVVVVLGNPPYRDKANGTSRWIEDRGHDREHRPNLDAFRALGNGKHEYVLKNLSIYFWRWATWKVFDAHRDHPDGVVAFITTSAYATGSGFAGMREYLRRTADEGWIIDVSPEGHQPPVNTRVFVGTQHPICIGIFLRSGRPDYSTPATVHHVAVHGVQHEKFDKLDGLHLGDADWTLCREGWQEPFAPPGGAAWSAYPEVGDLFPWAAPGVKPNRTWVYAPDPETLRHRWSRLIHSPAVEKSKLFKETTSSNLDRVPPALFGYPERKRSISNEANECPNPVRIGYRSFDRQWTIPDSRLHHRPSPDLWRVNGPGQIFIVEQHAQPVENGPGLMFSALIPDMDYFMGHHGGRVLAMYRDAAGATPNVAPLLLDLLSDRFNIEVKVSDLVAYVAAVVAHRGYTERFRSELRQPGMRVPITADRSVWQEAVELGQKVVCLQTYGERYVSGGVHWRPRVRKDGPRVAVTIPDTSEHMPDEIRYTESTRTLHIGDGEIRPVSPSVWNYRVGTMQVVKKWCEYRKKRPSGRRSSPLNDINATTWTASVTGELLGLLTVLNDCIELEPDQAALLDRAMIGPLITVADLTEAGVFPIPSRARKPPPRTDSPTLWDEGASSD